MDENKKQLWLRSCTTSLELGVIMEELDKTDIGPGVIECWLRDLVELQNKIEYLEDELQRKARQDGHFY